MKSMTGFGKSEAETTFGRVVVEARSENHRFLDVKLQLPESLLSIETELIESVKKFLQRGKVKVSISLEGIKNNTPVLNLDLAKQYGKNLDILRKEIDINEEIRIEHFLMIKDIFASETQDSLTKNQIAELEAVLRDALAKLADTRKSEGKKLEKDLRARIRNIQKLSKEITAKRKDFMKTTSAKLQERISRLLADVQIDEARLFQETAYMTERSDITEELVRLKAHVGKFRETIRKEDSIGKELDFLVQEMNREAGTISAKAKDAEISHLTIELRSELERIREQIQNIE